MITSVQQTPYYSNVRIPSRTRTGGQQGVSQKSLGSGAVAEGAKSPFFDRETPDVVRAGFGEGTLSVPGAAVRTLRRGLTSARQLVPTAAEVRDQLRTSASDKRKAQTQQLEPRTVSQPELRAPEAADPARDLVNAFGQAAASAQGPVAGQTPASSETRATVEINGQALTYLRNQPKTANTPAPPRFDMRA